MSLRSQVVKGIIYTSSLKVFSVLVAQISAIFIAILILPRDFGLYSIAALFVGLFLELFDFGFGSAVIHEGSENSDTVLTGAALQIAGGVFGTVVLLAVGPWIGGFYGDPQLPQVLSLLVLTILLSSLGFLPAIQLRSKLEFRILAKVSVISSLLSSTVAVTLALVHFGIWALVGGAVAGSASNLIALYLVYPWKPRFVFDRGTARKLFRYSKYVFASNLMVFLVFNIDNAVIGKVLGLDQLGYYVLAFSWGGLAADTMGRLVNQVMFPALVSIRDNRERLLRAYRESLRYLVYVSVPVYVILLVTAEDFVTIVLGGGGPKWLPAVPTLRVLCGLGLLRSLIEPLSVLLMATGNVRVLTKLGAVQLGLLSLVIYPGIALGGILGSSVVVTGVYLVSSVLAVVWASRVTGLSHSDLTRPFWPGLAPGLPTLGVLALISTVNRGLEPLGKLGTEVFAGLATYFLVAMALSRGNLWRDLRTNLAMFLEPESSGNHSDRSR